MPSRFAIFFLSCAAFASATGCGASGSTDSGDGLDSGDTSATTAGGTAGDDGGSGSAGGNAGGNGGGGGDASADGNGGTGGNDSGTDSSTGGANGGGNGGGGDAGPQLPAGTACTGDGDCASGLCKPVLLGSNVCVIPCTQNSDCNAVAASFCEATTAGSTTGYCIPRSPAHCLSCAQNSDCGSLSEVCAQLGGDTALSCHVDCAIAGAAACPSGYTCSQESVNGANRSVCMPNAGISCLDSIGGFCDRVGVPQPCTRSNAAGTCIGQRQCLQASNRYDVCGATAPQYKTDCSQQDPAGCTLQYSASATQQVNNCGACSHVCPGIGQTADNVTCSTGTSPASCTFSCQGESYDVDNNPANGCEKADSPTGNHAPGSSTYFNSYGCSDGSSNFNMQGTLPSDARIHENPTVTGFDGNSGSAPDWWTIYGSGGFCYDDAQITLTMSGATSGCYVLHFTSSKSDTTCTISGASCSINGGDSTNYSDGDTLYFEVYKICSTATIEAPTYSITGHL